MNENLNYELWGADGKIKKDSVHLDKEISLLPNSLTSVKLVVKLLWYLEETSWNRSKSANTNDAFKETIEILENSFIIEQLSFVSCKPAARVGIHHLILPSLSCFIKYPPLHITFFEKTSLLTMALDNEMKLGETGKKII